MLLHFPTCAAGSTPSQPSPIKREGSKERDHARLRLAVLGTLSRNAGEGPLDVQPQSPSPAPREREDPVLTRAGWVRAHEGIICLVTNRSHVRLCQMQASEFVASLEALASGSSG